MLRNGIATARYAVVQDESAPLPEELALPLVLKPVCQGSSVGLQFVHEPGQWSGALRASLKHGGSVLVEECIAGREVTDIVFMGTGGRLSIFRTGYRFLEAPDAGGEEITHFGPYGNSKEHLANWLDCMVSRKQPNADVVAGHYSSMACHIGNQAFQEKSCVQWRKEWDV